MSTVMYCYWVEKDKLFQVADEIRKFCYSKMFVFDFAPKQIVALSNDSEHHVNIQVFDVNDENRYLVRFLSNSYLIENNAELFDIESCFYDNRSDMTEDEMKNEKYAEMIDRLIDEYHYFIVPVVDAFGMVNHAYFS